MSKSKRIVITGIGPLSSIGTGKEDTWKNILQENVSVGLLENYIFGEYHKKFKFHKINDFNINRFGVNSNILENIKKWQYGEEVIDLYYLLAAIKLALDDSSLEYGARNDIGFVLTHENPGIEQFCSTFINKSYDLYKNKQGLSAEEYFNTLNYAMDTNVNDLQTFIYLFYASRLFDVHGYSLFINNSCASGSYAIETASQTIRDGMNKAVIVASSEHPAIYKHLWFEKLNILSKGEKTRPFSIDRDGFLCGEGGSALVVEDYDHAIERGAHIYAEYVGGTFNQECWKITVPDICENSYAKTITAALKKCELVPNDIDIITTHGLGAPLVDQYEAKAVADVFGEYTSKPYLTAFKPYFGHTLGNCVLLETITLLLSMQENTVLPVLNSKGEDPRLKINLNKEIKYSQLNAGMKIVWGFGGYNAATIFKKIGE